MFPTRLSVSAVNRAPTARGQGLPAAPPAPPAPTPTKAPPFASSATPRNIQVRTLTGFIVITAEQRSHEPERFALPLDLNVCFPSFPR